MLYDDIHERIEDLYDRLEAILEAETLDSVELAEAYVTLGFLNCIRTYKVIIESEEYESILTQIEALEAL